MFTTVSLLVPTEIIKIENIESEKGKRTEPVCRW